ncbi:MAG: hypothetical protein IJG37_05930, partial [Synergistaceae bacterium]|nr:hypothetical protein [Synergistaceae bacterium]
MKWGDIAEVYRKVFADVTGREMEIVYVDRSIDDTAQWKYDRMYNRIFDNSKIRSAVRNFRPVPIREGLTRCLTEFLTGGHDFRRITGSNEGKMDRIAGTSTPLGEIHGVKDRAKYFLYRYTPALAEILRQ